jgi:hypothetical protein
VTLAIANSALASSPSPPVGVTINSTASIVNTRPLTHYSVNVLE